MEYSVLLQNSVQRVDMTDNRTVSTVSLVDLQSYIAKNRAIKHPSYIT